MHAVRGEVPTARFHLASGQEGSSADLRAQYSQTAGTVTSANPLQ
jgi:hypothetical protein